MPIHPTFMYHALGPKAIMHPKIITDPSGRALIHVFNNPFATDEYLSWGYLSKKLEFFTPYQYI